jgi:hypothetical protein
MVLYVWESVKCPRNSAIYVTLVQGFNSKMSKNNNQKPCKCEALFRVVR